MDTSKEKCSVDQDCRLLLECDRKNVIAELKAENTSLLATMVDMKEELALPDCPYQVKGHGTMCNNSKSQHYKEPCSSGVTIQNRRQKGAVSDMNCPKCNRQMSVYYALKQFYCQYCPCTIHDKSLLHPDKARIIKLEAEIAKLKKPESEAPNE